MPSDSIETSTVEQALAATAEVQELRDSLFSRTQEVVTLQSNFRALDEEKKNMQELITKGQELAAALRDKNFELRSANATLVGEKQKLRIKIETITSKWWFKLFASRRMKEWIDRAL